MPTMPTREALRAAFDAAVQEIDQSRERPMLTTGFYAEIGDAVFDAGYRALEDFCKPERPAVPRAFTSSPRPQGAGRPPSA
jgi:hypothetical protein